MICSGEKHGVRHCYMIAQTMAVDHVWLFSNLHIWVWNHCPRRCFESVKNMQLGSDILIYSMGSEPSFLTYHHPFSSIQDMEWVLKCSICRKFGAYIAFVQCNINNNWRGQKNCLNTTRSLELYDIVQNLWNWIVIRRDTNHSERFSTEKSISNNRKT